ncbi:DUF938 domain-containing protein [Rhodoferax antarcticus]|uniref:SAM-dependent methyltransferase domain protein n=1 Tax=Rhodoferax antarcticus ANT.BR TaxID=1111071 RepID=A0A1Q8YB53_9BURK|nr:DUF938 domain-containing protein [Rhodoferax antarcticus]APW47199.1 SAM-dependent methyltransferase [Rhodoferax antarcticus]MCW2312183.1 hypothetical protein [Rhodoferax antarcticus]OLP05129.1 SAM-dependent methyltransferase domain protein [Rhodoferax antarcticus ANT.BR]
MFTPDFSPSAEQNKQPILTRLLQLLPAQGTALEIASGTGQHAASFASHLPGWTWQPTDTHSNAFASINHYAQQAGASNVLAPQQLDVCAERWLAQAPGTDAPPNFDLIFCANMLHIAPWTACTGLMRGSARHLAPGGVLVTYGPYLEQEVPTAPSNLGFDASLRAHNPAWGVRWREDVQAQAQLAGLCLAQRHTMPANNLLLVWAQPAAAHKLAL